MARRGTNNFRINDGSRAVRLARREGVEVTMIEIIGRDGVTFRIHGKASSTPTEAEKAWDDATTELQKAKPEKKASRSARPAVVSGEPGLANPSL